MMGPEQGSGLAGFVPIFESMLPIVRAISASLLSSSFVAGALPIPARDHEGRRRKMTLED